MQVGVEKANSVTGKDEIELGPQKREMTVRDLLRYTSGLVYPPQFVDSPIHRLYRKAVFARDKTLADFINSLAQLRLRINRAKFGNTAMELMCWGELSRSRRVNRSTSSCKTASSGHYTWSTPASTFLRKSLVASLTRPTRGGRRYGK